MDSPKASRTWFGPIGLLLAPALLLALGVLVILFDGLRIESGLGNRLFDAYQRHAARPFADMAGMPVRVLELPSLDEDRLVEITRTLAGQGVRMLVFTAPVESGPSPRSLAARLPPDSDAARAALAKLPEPGHELAAAIAETKAILPVMLGEAGRVPGMKAHFIYRGTRDPFGPVPRFDTASAPPALLQTHAAGLAAANLVPDSDGVVRRMAVAFRGRTILVPGMAAEVLRVVARQPEITVISDERDPLSFFSGIGIAALETSTGQVPTDKHGQAWLRYAADASRRMLNPDVLTALPLKGAIVVVGLEGDMVKTPLGLASLASVTGDAIENFAGNTVLARPSWAPIAEALLLAALGMAMIFLLRFGLGWAALLTMAAPAVMGLGSWYLYAAHGVLADWATPALFLALAFAVGAIAWLHDLQMTYAGLRLAFSDSLPRAALAKIARQPQLLNMEGETRIVTYLVCGVRAPENDGAASSLVQKMLMPLTDQVLAHGGTLDRQSADGFTAFWNAPLDDPDHALHACEAALAMTIVAAQVTHAPAQQEQDTAVAIHVGIATGAVIAGGFGGHGRMGYGVHGDAVALAERIQALSPRYAWPLIVADATRRLADHSFAFLEIDAIAGGSSPSILYALTGNNVTRASPKFRALTVFHDHIFQAIRKQNWRVARELIAQCRRLSGANQKFYDLHLARIAYYETHPPAMDWDGAFRPILE
jgi:adenylate cyclase